MMQLRSKYVVTSDKKVIVFTELIQHSTFKHLEPISAGFVNFNVCTDSDGNNNASCTCYGSSIGLGLGSNPEQDEKLIKTQILGYIPGVSEY